MYTVDRVGFVVASCIALTMLYEKRTLTVLNAELNAELNACRVLAPTVGAPEPPAGCIVERREITDLKGQLERATANAAELTRSATAPAPPAATEGSSSVGSEATIGDFMTAMNNLCGVLKANPAEALGRVAVFPHFFCLAHLAEFQKGFDGDKFYSYDVDLGRGTDYHPNNLKYDPTSYYRGVGGIPLQMAAEQYLAIMVALITVPHRTVKDGLERDGAAFVDDSKNYDYDASKTLMPKDGAIDASRGREGPRMLFIGCGGDVPMWTTLMKYLGGHVTFFEDNKRWEASCKDAGADNEPISKMRVVPYHSTQYQLADAIKDVSLTGSDSVPEKEQMFEKLLMKMPRDVLEGEPYDVIVVDGPGGINGRSNGRSEPLYMAKRLAQMYGKNHYTHIYLHDSARDFEVLWANKIMGHDPKDYQGSILPRKGLKHWRMPGLEKPWNPPLQ